MFNAKKKAEKDKIGKFILLCLCILLAIFFAVKLIKGTPPKPGPDNCIGESPANTTIVLDYTENISDQTRQEIIARVILHIQKAVKENERVSIFTVSELSKKSLVPLVSLCRPPNDGNRISENVQVIKKRFLKNFEEPIRAALSSNSEESNESPIAQALTDISLSQYLRSQTNTLLIYSDMLEHTSKFSLYKCDNPAQTINKYRESRRGALERPEFLNTQIQINLIPRLDQTKETLKCRDQLWPWFFGNNSGPNASISTDYLPGGSSQKNHTKAGTKL